MVLDYCSRHRLGEDRAVVVELDGELPYKSWKRNGHWVLWEIGRACGFRQGRGWDGEFELVGRLHAGRVKLVVLTGLESIPRRYGANVAETLLSLFRNALVGSGVHLLIVAEKGVFFELFEGERFVGSVRRLEALLADGELGVSE